MGPAFEAAPGRPLPPTTRNMAPIVPRATIAGRALIAVVAIMTFLASVTTGAVLLVRAAAAEWQSDIASEMTIQVRPAEGRNLDRDVRTVVDTVAATDGILDVRPFTEQESGKLLEPWLGTGLSLGDLPVPRVIVARVVPGASLDLATLRSRLAQSAPSATVDDHRAWIERMRTMTNAIVLAGLGILALVIIATIISVSFATRGAMASNRPIVEVLHFVGAGDRYIANHFLRHFLRLGLEGGLIGAGAAVLLFGFAESIGSWFSGTPVGDQFAALLGTFSLRPSGYLVLVLQAVVIAMITAWSSRHTLLATLAEID
ncbi:cell division protein FtsX [Afipia sp. P52-10]|jgi:cell division transport system permease protein|uniref:cell division protein FtsX n=1 Tax=Afipia sp. P52-10 TaxID=1429916 RepID=UPI0003DEF9AF|nr:ABC transporter permease [Afipia sp. P52-10]ETR77080.1 cell division protein FtsX [Afipia sp. P52-10]